MADMKIIIGADIKNLQSELAKAGGVTQNFANQTTAANAKVGTSFRQMKLSSSDALGGIKQFAVSGAIMAGIGLAIAGAAKWFEIIKKDFINTGKSAEDAGKKIKEYNDLVNSVTASVAKETTEVIGLLAVLNNETETRKRKLDAIKELQKIQPEIFKGLKLEGEAVIGLDEAYKSYLANLKNVIAAKIIQAQIEKNVTELLKIQGAANTKDQQAQLDNLKNLINTSTALSTIKKELQDTKIAGGFLTDKQTAARVAALTDEIQGLFEKLTEFSNTIKVKEIKIKPEKVTIEDADKLSAPWKGAFLGPEAPKMTIKPDVTIVPNVKEVVITPEAEKAVLEGMKKLFDKAQLEQFKEDTTALIQDAISEIQINAITSAAEAVGEALAGNKNALPDLFGNLIKGIGNQIANLGKALISAGIKMLAAKKAISALNITPQTAIIAGVALVILGSALKASLNKQAQGFASGTTGVSQGGFYDVGERGRERVFLPQGSKVQPANEVQAFGSGGVMLQPSIHYEGTGFRIMLNRVDAQMSRNG